MFSFDLFISIICAMFKFRTTLSPPRPVYRHFFVYCSFVVLCFYDFMFSSFSIFIIYDFMIFIFQKGWCYDFSFQKKWLIEQTPQVWRLFWVSKTTPFWPFLIKNSVLPVHVINLQPFGFGMDARRVDKAFAYSNNIASIWRTCLPDYQVNRLIHWALIERLPALPIKTH